MHRRILASGRWLLAVGWVHLLAPTAHAQYQTDRYGEDDKGVMQWLIMLGVLILLGVVGMMNPKRSHKD